MGVPGPKDEPAVYAGGAMGLFAAVITAANVFEVIHWTTEQQVAASAVAVIVLPAVQGLITRQWVRPAARSVPATVEGVPLMSVPVVPSDVKLCDCAWTDRPHDPSEHGPLPGDAH